MSNAKRHLPPHPSDEFMAGVSANLNDRPPVEDAPIGFRHGYNFASGMARFAANEPAPELCGCACCGLCSAMRDGWLFALDSWTEQVT